MDGVKFTMDLSSSGAAKLKECVKNKLSEYIGNYTDDVLVVRFLITSYENTRVASVCRIQTSSYPVSYSTYILILTLACLMWGLYVQRMWSSLNAHARHVTPMKKD